MILPLNLAFLAVVGLSVFFRHARGYHFVFTLFYFFSPAYIIPFILLHISWLSLISYTLGLVAVWYCHCTKFPSTYIMKKKDVKISTSVLEKFSFESLQFHFLWKICGQLTLARAEIHRASTELT